MDSVQLKKIFLDMVNAVQSSILDTNAQYKLLGEGFNLLVAPLFKQCNASMEQSQHDLESLKKQMDDLKNSHTIQMDDLKNSHKTQMESMLNEIQSTNNLIFNLMVKVEKLGRKSIISASVTTEGE